MRRDVASKDGDVNQGQSRHIRNARTLSYGADGRDTLEEERTSPLVYVYDEDTSPVSEILHALPSHLARGLLYIVLVFLALVLVWSSTTTIDVVTNARALLIPEGKEQLIQPSLAGIVQAIRVQEGDSVTRGQELVVIEAEDVGKSLADLRTAENNLALARRELAETVPLKTRLLDLTRANEHEKLVLRQEMYQLSVEKAQEKIARYEVERKNANSALALARKEREVNERLRKLGLIADIKVLEGQRTLEEAEFRLENVGSLLREARKERELLDRDFAVTRKQYDMLQHELTDQRQRLLREAEDRYTVAALQHQQAEALARLNLRGVQHDIVEQMARGEGQVTNRIVIRAPDDGVIAQMHVRNPGEAVSRGQTLMTLIPRDAPLLAELSVLNKDMGTLRLGQMVKLKFDAFSYAQYGAISGSVLRIAPDALVDSAGNAVYRVLVALQQTYFRVHNSTVPLMPGMTAAAEIVTDQKTILAVIFRPFAELIPAKEAEK